MSLGFKRVKAQLTWGIPQWQRRR